MVIGIGLLIGGLAAAGWLVGTGRTVRSGAWGQYGWEVRGAKLHATRYLMPVSTMTGPKDASFLWFWTTDHGRVPTYPGIVPEWNAVGLVGKAGIPGIVIEYEAVLWPIPTVLLAAGAPLFVRGQRSIRRVRLGLCLSCGYDLNGVPVIACSGRTCPECGGGSAPRTASMAEPSS